ncbi:MAG: TolC family outer membrane protein [Paracoccaceae bacterium]
MQSGLTALVGVLIGTLVWTGPAAAETLSDALANAYRNSGLIDQNRAVLRAADEDVAGAVAALRPVLNYTANAGYSDTAMGSGTSADVGLSASLLLFDFGRSALSVDALKETVLATRAQLVDIENAVLLNAVNAYLGVRRAEAFVELRENNVRLLTQQLRATRDRFEVGEVTRTDVSLAEARLAAARSGLAAEQGGLALAQEQYRVAVGEYPGRLASPPRTPSIPATEAGARDIARAESPALKQVQHQVAAAELRVEGAKRGLYPTVNGTASFSIDDDRDDTRSLGINLSGPIYRGGSISSSIRQSMALRDQARANLYTVGLQIDQEVGNAYANLAVAVASIDASSRQVEAARLALEGVREEFQLGARTTLDVLDQEQEVLDAQTNLVSATVDRQIAVYQVLDAMGRLTAQRLALNVPIYDPAAYYNAVKDAPTVNVSPEGKRLDRVLRSLGKQ